MDKNLMRKVLVIGDNPHQLVEKFSAENIEMVPYVKYKASEKDKLFKIAKAMSEKANDERYRSMMDSFDPDTYWEMITSGMDFDKDGNAITTENREQKFDEIEIGGGDASIIPLKSDMGANPVSSAKYADIMWEDERITEMMRTNIEKGNVKPEYIARFKDADECISFNTQQLVCDAITDGNEWFEFDPWKMSDIEWISGFRDRVKGIVGDSNPSITIGFFM